MTLIRAVLVVQGAIYVVTGIWPLVSIASFEAVTGPKTDDWLVHTVGLLLAVIGAVLLAAAARRVVDGLVVALAVGVALSLAVIDVVYVANGTIARIYLADAALEGLIAALLLVVRAGPAARGRGP
jgi:hypothetical protein